MNRPTRSSVDHSRGTGRYGSDAQYQLLRAMPKAELHCHLDGSLRPASLLEMAAERGVALPRTSAEDVADYMRVDDARDLEGYLSRFGITLAVMQDGAGIERAARELVEDAASDGIRYIEIRFCPALSTESGLTASDVTDAMLRGMSLGEQTTGTVARAIVCGLRSLPAPHSMEMAELAASYRSRGVVAFDLAGAESSFPAAAHADAFAFVRRNDLAVTVHAGEGAGAASIREAVHECGADRIGHGVRLFEDPSLEQYVIDREIPLEACPTSNVQTRVVREFADHPLAHYVRRGALVTLSTDNRLMSDVTLTDEYVRCMNELALDFEALANLALASFDAAFIDAASRRAMRDAAAAEISALRRTPEYDAIAPASGATS